MTASKRPVCGRRYIPVGPGDVAAEGLRERSSVQATRPTYPITFHQSAATKRAMYRRLALDPDFMPHVGWWRR